MTGLDVLEKKISEHEQDMTTALVRGGIKDFGEYQRICGVIYGLSLARMDIQDLRQKMEHMDE
jgi:hypothetical protein